MNFLAMKMLVGDRLKYLSLVAGLAFAALLVTQQASIFCGYALRTGSWIHDEAVLRFVGDERSGGFHGSEQADPRHGAGPGARNPAACCGRCRCIGDI